MRVVVKNNRFSVDGCEANPVRVNHLTSNGELRPGLAESGIETCERSEIEMSGSVQCRSMVIRRGDGE